MAVSNRGVLKTVFSKLAIHYSGLDYVKSTTLAQELRVSPWPNFGQILRSVITLIYWKPDITTEFSHLGNSSATLSKLM